VFGWGTGTIIGASCNPTPSELSCVVAASRVSNAEASTTNEALSTSTEMTVKAIQAWGESSVVQFTESR